MEFELKILGSCSATPSFDRHHTAQILTIGNQISLIDCGEGTQMQLSRFKIKHQRICNIFISHLHGDHYFGLVGLLSTMHLNQRSAPIHLFGPKGLAEILTLQFKYASTQICYPIHFHEVDTSAYQQIFEDTNFTVHTLPMQHRVECCGYLFREKPKPRRLIKGKFPSSLTPQQMLRLKWGEDLYNEQGELMVSYQEVTSDPKPSRSYAYCSDTRYKEDILPYITGVDLLYHEATFLQDMLARAEYTCHSTAAQAATLALKAQAKRLIIGHFSARYKDLTPLLLEAQTVFPSTSLAIEGESFSVSE